MSSETSKHRALAAPYCSGNGLDLGSGGDPVVESAISVDLGAAEAEAYTTTNWGGPIQWRCDASDLSWLASRTCDYVFSSHLLEDFANWQEVLVEWMRVVKRGGCLILLVPEMTRWAQAVSAGQPMNHNHAHEFEVGEIDRFIESQFGWAIEVSRMASDDLTLCGTPDYSIFIVARRTH